MVITLAPLEGQRGTGEQISTVMLLEALKLSSDGPSSRNATATSFSVSRMLNLKLASIGDCQTPLRAPVAVLVVYAGLEVGRD